MSYTIVEELRIIFSSEPLDPKDFNPKKHSKYEDIQSLLDAAALSMVNHRHFTQNLNHFLWDCATIDGLKVPQKNIKSSSPVLPRLFLQEILDSFMRAGIHAQQKNELISCMIHLGHAEISNKSLRASIHQP